MLEPQGLTAGGPRLLAKPFTSRDLLRSVADVLAGDAPEADRLFAAAALGLAAIDVVFDEAVVQLEHAEWLSRIGRPDEADQLLARARETFERLRATPWLRRASTAETVAVD